MNTKKLSTLEMRSQVVRKLDAGTVKVKNELTDSLPSQISVRLGRTMFHVIPVAG